MKRYSKKKPRKRYSKKKKSRYSKRTKSRKIKKNKRLTRLGKLWIKQMEIYMKFREVQ